MKTQIISGGHRTQSQSIKVANFIAKMIEKRGGEAKVTNLARNALPLWDEGVWAGEQRWKDIWGPIETDLKASDSYVIVTPEYNGMASPAIKNFFLFCRGEVVGHKPALLVSVTATLHNGAYPIHELRSSSFKNNKMLYIPDHVICREDEKILNGETPNPDSPTDAFTRVKLDYGVDMLKVYASAMKAVRESGVPNYKDFGSGM